MIHPRRRRSFLVRLALVVALAGTAAAYAGGSEATGVPPVERTALAVAALTPYSVTGSDGREHVEYDLVLTNATDAPVALRSIDVLDGSGRRLLRLEGDALADVTHELLRPPPAATVPPSATVAATVDLLVPGGARPERLTHRIAYDLPPDAPSRNEIGSYLVRGPAVNVPRRGAVVIAPPLPGGEWLSVNACCDSGHREALFPADGRFVKPETFAVDFVGVRDGRVYEGDGSQPGQWFGEGTPLVAVADGTVVRAVDGRPEIQPAPFGAPSPRTPDEFGGNYVVLRIGPGLYAFYAHVRPGTVGVRVGQRVRAGQRLGELGNSGNTTAPHLHFSIQDGPDPGTSNGLPFEIDRYRLVGSGRLVPAGGSAVEPSLEITETSRAERRTYPLTGALVEFRTR